MLIKENTEWYQSRHYKRHWAFGHLPWQRCNGRNESLVSQLYAVAIEPYQLVWKNKFYLLEGWKAL